MARALGLQRLINPSVATDLRLLGRSPDAHLARCLLAGAAQRPDRSGRRRRPGPRRHHHRGRAPRRPCPGCWPCAGTLLPNLTIRSEAAKRRRSFNHSLSAFLDLVAVNLAAGRGIEGALDTAADAGTDGPSARSACSLPGQGHG